MSNSGEKTEEPTNKKLQDSREKGQIPPKKSAIDTFSLFAGFALIGLMFQTLSMRLQAFTKQVVDLGPSSSIAVVAEVSKIGWSLGAFVYFYAASVALTTIVFGLAANNFNFSLEPLKPDVRKVNPITGFKNIFSMISLVNLIRMLLFFVMISVTIFILLFGELRSTIGNIICGTHCIAEEFLFKIKMLIAAAILSQFFLSLIDLKMQIQIFRKQQKMSKDEVKRENKSISGDPLIKNQRMAIAREDASAPTMRDVSHVVYSRHYLVALINRDDTKKLPYVVLKASGDSIPRLLASFRSYKKNIIYYPDVARDFFEMAVTGKELPARSGGGMAKLLKANDPAQKNDR